MKLSAEAVQERRDTVLKLIQESGRMSVKELADHVQVSMLTLRRDLDSLEAEGLIRRFHGGACAVTNSEEIMGYEDKAVFHLAEKEQIATYVAKLIPENTTLFLNAGTTTLEVIKRLKNKGVTIITNNALAFSSVQDGNCEIICTGGSYHPVSKAYNGDLATGIVQKTYAEYCILGINGISASSGITSSIFQETIVNEMMTRHCHGPKIIVADSSKIGSTLRFSSFKLSDVDLLVTVSAADGEQLQAIAAQGVKIVFADQELVSGK